MDMGKELKTSNKERVLANGFVVEGDQKKGDEKKAIAETLADMFTGKGKPAPAKGKAKAK